MKQGTEKVLFGTYAIWYWHILKILDLKADFSLMNGSVGFSDFSHSEHPTKIAVRAGFFMAYLSLPPPPPQN